MNGHPRSTEASQRLLSLAACWARAGVVFASLLLLAATAYRIVLQLESESVRSAPLERYWGAIQEHLSTAATLRVLGPPTEARDTREVINVCDTPPATRNAGECIPASYACVRELTWVTWRDTRSGRSYSVCLDGAGVVRRKSEGVRFGLNPECM
jgi:hypothetical protein